MPLAKDRAIVLHKTDLKEYDEIATMLGREHGLIQLVCRGSRRAKGRLRGIIEPLHEIDVVYYEKEGADLGNLNQANLLDSHQAAKRDMASLAAGLFLLEVTRKCLAPGDPAEEVYDALAGQLARFPRRQPSAATVEHLASLAAALGYTPHFESCVVCTGAEEADLKGFSPEHGSLLCAACWSSDPRAVAMTGGTMRALVGLFAGEDAEELELRPIRGLRMALLRYLETHLDFRAKSLSFLLTAEE